VIVRILSEGQYELDDEAVAELNTLDDELTRSIDAGDDGVFRAALSSLLAKVREAGKPHSVAFYACGGPNAGVKVVGNSGFPNLVEETRRSFRRLKALKPDIYLTMHPQTLFAGKVERIKAGETPHPLYDPDGWTKMIAGAEANFLKRVEEEQRKTAAAR